MKETVLVILVLIIGVGASVVFYKFTQSKAISIVGSGEQSGVQIEEGAEQSKNIPQVDLTAESEINVNIKGFAYEQPNIKIKKGTIVTWTNLDVMEHNVMEEHDDNGSAHEAPEPEDIDPSHFVGPLLKKGQSYSFLFDKAGSITYHCAPHPEMVGFISVVD